MRVLSSLQIHLKFLFVSGSIKRELGVLCNVAGSVTRMSPKLNTLEKTLMAVTNINKANPSVWIRVVSRAQMDKNQTVACRKRV